jgi:hypothetical protein
MASVALSRRVGRIVGYPPISEMSAERRRTGHVGATAGGREADEPPYRQPDFLTPLEYPAGRTKCPRSPVTPRNPVPGQVGRKPAARVSDCDFRCASSRPGGSFRRDPSPSLLPAGSRMKEALDADHFEDLPGKFQAGILEAEQKRPKLRVVESS